ncbi:MAG TPA: hypothetical protein VGG25_12810 [Streptosporangiaceae bacterium]
MVSASRNGVAITESDPTYAVSASGQLQPDGEFLTQWSIADALIPGSYATLAPGDVGVPFSITINTGKHRPRVTDEYAGGASAKDTFFSRGGTWQVTISGDAVEQASRPTATRSPGPAPATRPTRSSRSRVRSATGSSGPRRPSGTTSTASISRQTPS